jgi:peptide/nickel transport system permease protein
MSMRRNGLRFPEQELSHRREGSFAELKAPNIPDMISMPRILFARAGLAIGKSGFGVTRDHVLPNIGAVLIVQATIQFAVAILAEAALAYLGLGTQPPAPSWGRMLFNAQTLMTLDPKLALLPGLAIALSVLGLNLLGDGLRDGLDPRLRPERVG